MRGEILSIETAEKLAKIEKVLKYINDTLKQAYTTYNLSIEEVMILQEIERILGGI